MRYSGCSLGGGDEMRVATVLTVLETIGGIEGHKRLPHGLLPGRAATDLAQLDDYGRARLAVAMPHQTGGRPAIWWRRIIQHMNCDDPSADRGSVAGAAPVQGAGMLFLQLVTQVRANIEIHWEPNLKIRPLLEGLGTIELAMLALKWARHYAILPIHQPADWWQSEITAVQDRVAAANDDGHKAMLSIASMA